MAAAADRPVFRLAPAVALIPYLVALAAIPFSAAWVAGDVPASLLFVLPTDWRGREFTLVWSDAARIDWGTVVLFGTGIVFGSLLDDTGLALTIGEGSADLLGLTSTLAITVFAAVATPSTDPVSMLLLAGPIWVLYFGAVVFALINDRRRRRRELAGPADDEASELDLTPEDIGEVEPVTASRSLPEQAGRDRVDGYDDVT